MPDATSLSLQDAQDAVQVIMADPLFYSESEDASAADRSQVLDAGWKVCSQEPAPGSALTDNSYVVFYVMRVSEECP